MASLPIAGNCQVEGIPALASFQKSISIYLPIHRELSTLKIDHCNIPSKTTHCYELMPDLSVLLKLL